ncbi:MAG: MGMT family protein [Clostridia bacterium]|nr:MGMT family protein [Clostridia bacterium]
MRSLNFFERVYEVVKRVPKGKVTTYGQVALLVGSPRAARQVGYALHVNPEPMVIPCHRVVNRFGALAPAFAFGGKEVQAALLQAEGVEVDENFSVDLQRYIWSGELPE